MDLYHLQTFYRVAQLRSFTRAAEELSLSQSAVSRHIEALEQEFGMALLTRSGRGAALTEAGERLYEYAERLLHLAQEASRSLAELRDLESGRLTVGASTTPGHYLLGPVVAAYQERYPGIELHLEIRDSQSVLRLVEQGLVDVAVLPEPPPRPAIATEPCLPDQLWLLAAPGHPLTRREQVRLSDLQGVRLFLREAGSGTREVVEQALAAQGVAPDAREVGSSEAIKRAAATGAGVAFCSRYACELEVRQGLLVPLTGPELPLTRRFVFAYPRAGRRTPAALAFVSLFRKLRPEEGSA